MYLLYNIIIEVTFPQIKIYALPPPRAAPSTQRQNQYAPRTMLCANFSIIRELKMYAGNLPNKFR